MKRNGRKRQHINLFTKKYKSRAARQYAKQSFIPNDGNKKARLKVKRNVKGGEIV